MIFAFSCIILLTLRLTNTLKTLEALTIATDILFRGGILVALSQKMVRTMDEQGLKQ